MLLQLSPILLLHHAYLGLAEFFNSVRVKPPTSTAVHGMVLSMTEAYGASMVTMPLGLGREVDHLCSCALLQVSVAIRHS
jgi:hypothetical protein